MNSKVFSCTLLGLEGQIVEVQADISNGLPSFNIVGLGDTSVQESKERVRASIKNCGAAFPQNRKTINLAPAQIKKQGSIFDLPIAVSILLASEQINADKIKDSIIIGELALNGDIMPVSGILAVTQTAKDHGFKKIFLPHDNAVEAGFITDVEIYPLKNLKDIVDYSSGTLKIAPAFYNNLNHVKGLFKRSKSNRLSTIVGLEKQKRALQVAAAGGHNILLIGPPGTGKTLLARSFPSLLPTMSPKEVLETTKIFSVSGLIENDSPLITKRPIREVHHSASLVSIIGGGSHPKPGEISLAHNGVLFFDEIAEFPRHVLDSLRQPLEDKFINIKRMHGSLKFPCNFIFVATMNPCPCGHKGDEKLDCICSESQVQNYKKRLSGPIMDRFDIFLDVPRIFLKDAFTIDAEQKNHELVSTIQQAFEVQVQRFNGSDKVLRNSEMTIEEIRKHCQIDHGAKDILKRACEKLALSNRGYLKILKIARTIADLDNSFNITAQHINEALQYRAKN